MTKYSESKSKGYETYAGLPTLAGLCSMERAVQAKWSVEESVNRLKRLHYVLKRLSEIFTSRITSEPVYELKTAFSYHAYLCSEMVTAIRARVSEMREPPLGLDKVPHAGLERCLEELQAAPTHREFVLGCYRVVLPKLKQACDSLSHEAHPLADAPTVRLALHLALDLNLMLPFGSTAGAVLLDDTAKNDSKLSSAELKPWRSCLEQCLDHAQGIDGTSADDSVELPARYFSQKPIVYDPRPRRDERFQDPYNAGVNPEAFLYHEAYAARDKTLMMYYKRLRELDVPEMMASILQETRDKPWEFTAEMLRQLWDEARHAMMGEVGFASLGIDWRTIPINFTWSLNLNTQLTAQERHGVLFFIEQGLMPRNGKRYEWEVAVASGSDLSALFQDFDWADEVLHSQIGRRWYVPQFASLNEALRYGDECWSKVLSHWQAYKDQGLTEHRNWWPDLYREACLKWNCEPDPQALAFNENYSAQRADLKTIGSS